MVSIFDNAWLWFVVTFQTSPSLSFPGTIWILLSWGGGLKITGPSALGMSDPIMDHCNWPFLETTMSMSSCPPYPGVGEVALRYVALVHHGPPLYDYWLSCWILLLFLLTAIKGCLSEFNIFLWTTTFESTRNQNSWVKNNSFSSWADDYQKDPIHLKREIIMLDIARKWLKRRRCWNVDKWSVRNESALLFTG